MFMSYHIGFKGIHRFNHILLKDGMQNVAGNLLKIKKEKMKHAYYKAKARPVV